MAKPGQLFVAQDVIRVENYSVAELKSISMVNLSFLQKAAIRDFLNHITSPIGLMKWDKSELLSVFEDYELNISLEISYTEYKRTLKKLSCNVKRDLVCRILNSWEYAGQGDFYTLYQTLQDILYLKIETGVECVLFNNLLNLSSYLPASNFSIDATAETDYYMIDVYYNYNDIDFDDNQVRFMTSSEEEQPRVEFAISASLLRKKIQFYSQPSQADVSELLNHLTMNHTKTHCPWIYLDYFLRCVYLEGFVPFLRVQYENIKYIDNNGEL